MLLLLILVPFVVNLWDLYINVRWKNVYCTIFFLEAVLVVSKLVDDLC